MSHTPFLQLMTAALDAKLPPGDRAALEAHLGDCAACRTMWDALREADARLSSAPTIPAPRNFTARFQARLAERQSTARVVWGGLTLGLGAVGAAVVVAVPFLGVIGGLAGIALTPGASANLLNAGATSAIALRAFGDGLLVTAETLLTWAGEQPMVGGGALLTLALAGAWAYVFKRFSPEEVTS